MVSKITAFAPVRFDDGVALMVNLASLKHFKDDVVPVGNAQEGGLMIEKLQ